jgi:transposase
MALMDAFCIGCSLVNLSKGGWPAMPKGKCLVILSDDERKQLEQLLRSGTEAIRKVTRARILLKAAEGWEDSAIAEGLSVGRATVERLRQRFIECRLGALVERPRPGKQPKLDEKAEARLLAEAYSAAPTGRRRWTLQLLADRVVALGLAESYSYESVRRVLKKRSQGVAEAAMAHPRPERTSYQRGRSRASSKHHSRSSVWTAVPMTRN